MIKEAIVKIVVKVTAPGGKKIIDAIPVEILEKELTEEV